MSKRQDTYKEVKTFEYPNMIVRVHVPDLTEEERTRRMKAIHRAAEGVLKELFRLEGAKANGA